VQGGEISEEVCGGKIAPGLKVLFSDAILNNDKSMLIIIK
jgi:hypothetical protein